MNNCFDLYLWTTNPHTTYAELVNMEVAFSVLFHVIAYLLIYMVLCQFFIDKTRPLGNLPIYLTLVMVTGYFGRLYRAKNIYASLLKNNRKHQQALVETQTYMRTGYFTYYFLG